ncbi:unnamed protein product, partial [Gadus morhua 'NCC']
PPYQPTPDRTVTRRSLRSDRARGAGVWGGPNWSAVAGRPGLAPRFARTKLSAARCRPDRTTVRSQVGEGFMTASGHGVWCGAAPTSVRDQVKFKVSRSAPSSLPSLLRLTAAGTPPVPVSKDDIVWMWQPVDDPGSRWLAKGHDRLKRVVRSVAPPLT